MTTGTASDGSSCLMPGRRLFAAADLLALPQQLPSGPVGFELDNGRLVPRGPNSARHGSIQARIGAELHTLGKKHGIGRAFMNVGVVLWRRPDRVVGPDAAFVTNRSLPLRVSPEEFLETVPELVVEIRDTNDSISELRNKVADYLKAGVGLVWNVDPATESVVEHRPNGEPRSFGKRDTLQCENIIPDFQLALAELFRQ